MDGHSVDGTTGGNTSLRASCSSDCSWTLSNCRPIIFGSFTSPSNGVASPISSFIDGIEDEGPFRPARTISTSYRNSSVRKSEIAPSFTRWMLNVALKVQGLIRPTRTKSTSSRCSSRHFLILTRCSTSLSGNMQTALVSRLRALSRVNTDVGVL